MTGPAVQAAKRATYPVYKTSGVESLGDVPEHWRVDRLKWTVENCKNGIWGNEPEGTGNDIICIRVADFDRDAFRVNIDNPTLRTVSATERAGRILFNGNLLLEKSGGGDLQPVGAVVIYDHDKPAVCSNFVARMPVMPSHAPRFLTYCHAFLYSARINTRSIKQTTGIQNLDAHAYLSEFIGHPPLGEQRTIAAFLDRETARIDALIEKKRRQIELLQEKRAALISHAVTKGLNPNTPMKDSGIEWLGQIPAHWEVAKLCFVSDRIGDGLHGTPEYLDNSGLYFVNGNNLVDEKILFFESTREIGPVEYQANKLPLSENTVLLSINGTIGNIGIYRGEKIMLGKSAAYINCGKKIKRMFLAKYLQSDTVRRYIDMELTGTTISNLSLASIRQMPIVLPPMSEQFEISMVIKKQTEKLKALVTKIRDSIDNLREYRTALISAAVTGKIDVQGEG